MPPYYRPVDLGQITKSNQLFVRRQSANAFTACAFFKGILVAGGSTAEIMSANESTDITSFTTITNQTVGAIAKNKDFVFVGTKGIGRSIQRSSDGITFANIHTPISDLQSGDANDSGEVAFITTNGTLVYSTNNGSSWNTAALGGSYNQPRCLRYLPGIKKWYLVNASADFREGATIAALIADASSSFSVNTISELSNVLYAGNNANSTPIMSVDGGVNWTNMSAPFKTGSSSFAAKDFIIFDNKIHMITQGGVLARLNSSGYWELLTSNNNASDYVCGCASDDVLYCFSATSNGTYQRILKTG